MNESLYRIALLDLVWLLLPIVVIMIIYLRWSYDRVTIPYALFRMLVQLLLIGYVLTYMFEARSPGIVVLALSVMLVAASIIALRPVRERRRELYHYAFIAIGAGGVVTLVIIFFGVLHLEVRYEPRFVIPLAGMVFANAMNGVSIAAERFESEMELGRSYVEARAAAYKAALIPILNALFAVGLVSLPGMMTGQILSGVDPLIAVRYQMMVMVMILGAVGLSAALYLKLVQRVYTQE